MCIIHKHTRACVYASSVHEFSGKSTFCSLKRVVNKLYSYRSCQQADYTSLLFYMDTHNDATPENDDKPANAGCARGTCASGSFTLTAVSVCVCILSYVYMK